MCIRCYCSIHVCFLCYICAYNQGSKKLDKAEILEMSIEYIQRIQQQAFGKTGGAVTGELCSGQARIEHASQCTFKHCSLSPCNLQVLIWQWRRGSGRVSSLLGSSKTSFSSLAPLPWTSSQTVYSFTSKATVALTTCSSQAACPQRLSCNQLPLAQPVQRSRPSTQCTGRSFCSSCRRLSPGRWPTLCDILLDLNL